MSGSGEFLKAVIDTLTDQIAVIDANGAIQFVNQSWVEFARSNGEARVDWRGVNYLEACDQAVIMGDEDSGNAVDGIRKVINGKNDSFYLEYPCHSPDTKRWFMMRVSSFEIDDARYFIVSHQNITERKLAEEEMLRFARLDGLTNVYNRGYFDEFLNNEWRRCHRLMMPVTLAIADIDNFKLFNDTYGHHAGDECLRKVAQVLSSFARRPADICARYGGEEFALLFGNTGSEESAVFVDQILASIRALKIPNERSPTGPVVTVSIGVATLQPDGETSQQQLIKLADARLYMAKLHGKDKLVRDGMKEALPG